MLKDNIIGAFCRAYNVYDVIEKFLYDVYKKGDTKDRYTYINGSTSNGVVIYENGNFHILIIVLMYAVINFVILLT